MNEIINNRIQEINKLHNEIGGALKITLDKAIRIGELLTEQKESLKHGEFTPWVNENLPFTDRTARRYMTLYRNRDRLKMDNVSDLVDAYKITEASGKENIANMKKELAIIKNTKYICDSREVANTTYARMLQDFNFASKMSILACEDLEILLESGDWKRFGHKRINEFLKRIGFNTLLPMGEYLYPLINQIRESEKVVMV